MKRQLFNDGWTVTRGLRAFPFGIIAGGPPESIRLPHDAMIHEKRVPNGPNKSSTGFYPGGNYTYIKKFHFPYNWCDKTIILEFEGVYMNAFVYINGDFAGGRLRRLRPLSGSKGASIADLFQNQHELWKSSKE